MDLIRIFAETAFSRIAERYLGDNNVEPMDFDNGLMFDEAMFVDVCRGYHPELSDDQLRVIYALYRDEWSFPPDHTSLDTAKRNKANRHIFNVLFQIAEELLRFCDGKPTVKFRHLFRWRETTQLLGEDLLTTAFLAYSRKNRQRYDLLAHGAMPGREQIRFTQWPTVLHNDNPHLHYIFNQVRLCELHSHLYASTDTFTITWVCLMNHMSARQSDFLQLTTVQDPSRKRSLATSLHELVAMAAHIRRHIWKHIIGNESPVRPLPPVNILETALGEFDRELERMRVEPDDPDYISDDRDHPMAVFAGERIFLFATFERIIRTDDIILYELFLRYILIKNRLRSFLVQVNDNRGFNNFKRFQDLKARFLTPSYSCLLARLPMWEAREFNYTDKFETRIAPPRTINKFQKTRQQATSLIDDDGQRNMEWSFIFHFLKIHDRTPVDPRMRDTVMRQHTATQGKTLRTLLESDECRRFISGIDAASSELACRPEVFAQVFRYLKRAGYSATFHAGEDFYDIADGLRTIFEAMRFLDLDSGDRIGHAIALGINASDFYNERRNYIALPAQWMLDNIIWLYYYAKEHNVATDPQTENFLLTTARNLMVEIGYESAIGGISSNDYYQSILLRGDNPELYSTGVAATPADLADGESWGSFDLKTDPLTKSIRSHNPNAAQLYRIYHFDTTVKSNGRRMKSFHVPPGYPALITGVQSQMISEISKGRIGIECCPSSNIKIGRLSRFDKHPIFRFMPVRDTETRYPLAVTVNTDDLGIFATSLPNEFSLLALALLKMKNPDGTPIYSSREVYDWIWRVAENGHKFSFHSFRDSYTS